MTADKAYKQSNSASADQDEGALPIIPNRRNAIKQAYYPKRFYRHRRKIESPSPPIGYGAGQSGERHLPSRQQGQARRKCP